MKQLTNDKELIGKVISQTLQSDDEFWMSFTDKSFAVFSTVNTTVGFGHADYAARLVDYKYSETSKELVTLGLITEFQHKQALLKQEEEYDKQQKEYREQERLKIEKIEKEQYELLAKKYGKR